jgi:hypothetical protein
MTMKREHVHSALRTSTKPVERMAYWILERESIRIRKERGDAPPWTKDPILREWRFCNVRREDDTVTRWLKKNWRDPHAKDTNLWHAILVGRFINWPDTLAECGWPEPWPSKRNLFLRRFHARQARGDKTFTSAYNISNGGTTMGKIDFVADLFNRAWAYNDPPRRGDTLAQAHAKLCAIRGVGSFMGAQIVADIKHTPLLKHARDWHDWAAPGPGSQRGLNRVHGYPLTKKWSDSAFISALGDLRGELRRHAPIVADLCLQDIQNVCCEFDKMERVLHGEGKPRARYRPDQAG